MKVGKEAGANTGNNVMRLFRRLHRFASGNLKQEVERDLVKDALEGQWFKVSRRQTCLKEHELPAWHAAVQDIRDPVIRDYLQLLLFTGLRENEGMSLRWNAVDMEGKTFMICDPKNRPPHTLPMSDVVHNHFQRRLDARENGFVFPGTEKNGHLTEVKRQIDFIERVTKKRLNGVESDEELEKLMTEQPADRIKPGYDPKAIGREERRMGIPISGENRN